MYPNNSLIHFSIGATRKIISCIKKRVQKLNSLCLCSVDHFYSSQISFESFVYIKFKIKQIIIIN